MTPVQRTWQIWKWPLTICASTLFSLIGALFEDDGWLDLICAANLLILIWLCLWFAVIKPKQMKKVKKTH